MTFALGMLLYGFGMCLLGFGFGMLTGWLAGWSRAEDKRLKVMSVALNTTRSRPRTGGSPETGGDGHGGGIAPW